MKKFTILTSVLALAACGGGGSNHSGGSAVPGGYVAPRPEVTAAVATSNAQITSMPSEVIVASNSSTPAHVIGVETQTVGDVTYASYRLDDVKLFIAENLDSEEHAYVNLELNNATGEIDAVKMRVGSKESGRIVRQQDESGAFTDTFAGPIFEYVKPEPGNPSSDQAVFRVVDNGEITWADLHALEAANTELSGGHWNRIDEVMAFETYGKNLGLQYADFGHFNPIYRSKNKNLVTDDDEDIVKARNGTREGSGNNYRTPAEVTALLNGEDYQLFAGGYAISGTTMVDTLTPENGTSYSGTAVGRVYVSIQSKDGTTDRDYYLNLWNVPDGSDGHDMAKAYTTTNASLTIAANGVQTLEMPFNETNDFYKVTVIKDTPTADPSIAFTETVTATNPYRRNDQEQITAAKTQEAATLGYYGVNTPVEAAGTVRRYDEQNIGTGDEALSDVKREWEFQAAYGMKKN